MRMRPQRVELLAEVIVSALQEEGLLIVYDTEEAQSVVRQVFLEELDKEAELDEEVRELLQGFQEYMMRERIPFHQMFRMIKEKLAKEKGIVL